jgi:hypothetical protein
MPPCGSVSARTRATYRDRSGRDNQKRYLILAKEQSADSGKFRIDQYDESGNLLANPTRLSNQMDE